MIDKHDILQKKIFNLFSAGIECSLFYKKQNEDEAKTIFGKTVSLAAGLYFEDCHNPLFGDVTDDGDCGERCELRIFWEGRPKTVRVLLFELQFDYFTLLLDNLMIRITECKETRRILVDTLNAAKLYKYLTFDASGRPDVVDNTICILFELYRIADKEKIRGTFISYLSELYDIDSFTEIYNLLKFTPKHIVDFVCFLEYLDISGKVEDFLRRCENN